MTVKFRVRSCAGWQEYEVSPEDCPAFVAKLQSDPSVIEWHAGESEHLEYCPDCRADMSIESDPLYGLRMDSSDLGEN